MYQIQCQKNRGSQFRKNSIATRQATKKTIGSISTQAITESNLIVNTYKVMHEDIVDEDNNIHINLTYNTSFDKLLSEQTIIYALGDILRLEILVCNLYIRKQQTITFLNRGIPRIVPSDIYNITRKSNVYIHLELLFDNI